MTKKFFKSILKVSFVLLLMLLALVWWCNRWVANSTEQQTYSSIDSIPFRNVGLVLGTNEIWHGGENPFFENRIEAAAALYNAGKIKYIIVSGDNHVKNYDEPVAMKNALIRLGIPASAIFLDYAGFRTFDSVIRCRDVFGQDTITIISQQFHNERALFIANHAKMSAIGFNAKNASESFSVETYLREYLARCKAVLDLYVLNTQPKFLGPKVKIY
jgi:SanA protein